MYASASAIADLATPRPLLVERAFQLARTGASLEAIRRQLKLECYMDVELQLDAKTLKRQLKAAGAQAAERSRLRVHRKPRAKSGRQAPSIQFKKCPVCRSLLTLDAMERHTHPIARAE